MVVQRVAHVPSWLLPSAAAKHAPTWRISKSVKTNPLIAKFPSGLNGLHAHKNAAEVVHVPAHLSHKLNVVETVLPSRKKKTAKTQ